MTASYPARWFDDRGEARPPGPDEHAALIAWEAEQDALREPILTCTCFVPDGRGKLEFSDRPCDVHRAAVLADIDRDGYDDKTEQPRGAA